MKYIIAIIQPGKLTAVHDALLEIGITGMTVTCLLYTSPSPRDVEESRMPSSA